VKNFEVVSTRAGALAMRSLVDGEVMHPGVGPLAEAETLYARQSRLAERLRGHDRDILTLFDIGLGAASNALAARAVAEAAPADAARLRIVSFERDVGALALALEAGAPFGLVGDAAEAARELLANGRHASARCEWILLRGDILSSLAALAESTRADTAADLAIDLAADPAIDLAADLAIDLAADLVFWDPFSPRANPSLWTIAAFAAVRRVARARCTLITYSASTATRVALLAAGFAVGVGDAVGEKAQTTMAAVDAADLQRPLTRDWLARLARADAPLPSDAPPDVVARVSSSPQFAARIPQP
jgi:queuine tRNA-ribosyltransferase